MGRNILFSVLLLALLSFSFASAAGTNFDNAQVITSGTITQNNLTASTVDYYKIELSLGERVTFTNLKAYNQDGQTGDAGTPYDGSMGVDFIVYDSQRAQVTYDQISSTSSPSSDWGYALSSEDKANYIYFAVRYNSASKSYSVSYSFDISFDNTSYKDVNGGDISSAFESAYPIKFGETYSGSLIAGMGGKDKKDMYKLEVGKNKKIGIELTPETKALLGVTIYDKNRQEVESYTSANKGAIIDGEYTSYEAQILYISTDRDFYNAVGGKYSLKISDLGNAAPVATSTTDVSEGLNTIAKIVALEGAAADVASTGSSASKYSNTAASAAADVAGVGGFFAILMGMIIFLLIFFLVLYVYMAWALYTTAKKTNTENAWIAWIPIVHIYTAVQIAQLPIWWIVLLLVPLINFFVGIYIYYKIAERRGYNGLIVLLMLIPLVGLIVPGLIAWRDPKPKSVSQ